MAGGLFLVSLLFYLLRQPLFYGLTTFWHDNLYWNLPNFHFFAESLLQGHLPLWSPYNHGGEPFWPLILQLRFLEPLTLATIFVGGLFTKNLLLLFHWNRVLLTLFMLFGAYLYLRPITKSVWTRLGLQCVLLFSSFSLGSFRADGYINHFLWTPYLALFLRNFFEENRRDWRTYLGITLCLGINFQSYFFVLPTTFALLYSLLHLKQLRPICYSKCLISIGILILFSLANFASLRKQNEFIFPARFLPADYQNHTNEFIPPKYVGGEYDDSSTYQFTFGAVMHGGAFSTFWDYIQLIAPEGNWWIYGRKDDLPKTFGAPSEAFLFIGILGWFFCLWGLCVAHDVRKKEFLFLTVSFILISLGPQTFLYRFLFQLWPPLWFLRHSQFAAPFVLFGLCYFFAIGLDQWISRETPPRSKVCLFAGMLIAHVSLAGFLHPDKLHFGIRMILFLVLPLLFPLRAFAVGWLFFELTSRFISMGMLYNEVPSPYAVLGLSPNVIAFTPPKPRKLSPQYPPIPLWGSQRPRYLSHLYREPYLFSRVIRQNETEDPFTFGRDNIWCDALVALKPYFLGMRANPAPTATELGLGSPLLTLSPQGNFMIQRFSPESWDIEVSCPLSCQLRLYQSNASDWKWTLHKTTFSPSGVFYQEGKLPAGNHLLKIRYRPKTILFSFLAFVVLASCLMLHQLWWGIARLEWSNHRLITSPA